MKRLPHDAGTTNADATLRSELLATLRAMSSSGLNTGTAGNASLRLQSAPGEMLRFLVTPSGVAADAATPDDMVEVFADGRSIGRLAPSTEWQLHRDIYAAFPAASAVLHAHSPFATALACQRADIPPFHYMIARFGGGTVRCAPYATFGTQELSDACVRALQERNACLMANHGMLVFGRDLAQALALAIELETLCAQYWRTLQLGPPALLTDAEMADVIARFRTYGKPQRHDSD